MPTDDPLSPLLSLGDITQLAAAATGAVAAVHRRPVNLRRAEITGSESVLRGARTSALLDGAQVTLDAEPTGMLGQAISVYGLLAPDSLQTSARTFNRAPLQILARMDTLAGGDGVPATPDGAGRLRVLAQVIGSGAHPALLPQIVHGEILAREIFGGRSGVIARAAGRLAAVATGFDPRGLAVPEPWLNRHRGDYERAAAGFAEGPEGVRVFVELLLRAWTAGAEEAEAIARAAS
ncbi:hypothetical protein [Corynebacterium halotolerans]|uniref:Oxidoreductase n=1 Tax=Corynebacterium halotolerans YIM 70093 = DSM 44683 TaxID=1121362 RepID=M1P3V0_9CORY|nr:hypothetical protein [Corynebacterium halotolerans]AGF71351.1 hypothetical protein A605_01685 [Corynebacterium halotolerans YIM 70093 = DSM 44683]